MPSLLEAWQKGKQAEILIMFCRSIGVTSVKFHTLRACFATHLLASGTQDAIVMRIGGWSNFKTFQIYVRLAGVMEKGSTEGLAAAFLPSESCLANEVSEMYSFPQISA